MSGALAAAVPPPMRSAMEPAEVRGSARDDVRLLVATSAGVTHADFRDLPLVLESGDLLVVNTSATLPAAVDAARGAVHFSTALPDGSWAVELRPGPSGSPATASVGDVIDIPDGRLRLLAPYPSRPTGDRPPRLWQALVEVEQPVPAYLGEHGRPIAYDYVPRSWPIAAYQTVFAREPGSAEMPSAGRPFTSRIVTDLVTAGVAVAPVTLHTGCPRWRRGSLRCPSRTRCRQRPLGSSTAPGTPVGAWWPSGRRSPEPSRAWRTAMARCTLDRGGPTSSSDRTVKRVSSLVWSRAGTNPAPPMCCSWKRSQGAELVSTAYAAARSAGYLWHEFGDSALLLR